MTPGIHSLGARLFGTAARNGVAARAGAAAGAGAAATGGFLSALSTFMIGAVAAGFVLSMIRQGEPRIARAFKGGETSEGKTLEELIAEKERIEDMIADLASREGKG